MRRWSVAVTVALTALSVAPGASRAQQPPDYETTTGESQPIYEDYVQEDYRVKTRYGRIYGVVVRPVVPDGVKVPVILTYSPYNILSRRHNAEPYRDLLSDYFVPRGYARALFDLVGTRESSGCYDYGGIRERKTGKAVVDFLGSREWSNGKVGMIGGSYDGTTQWAAAVETPKHLTTIIPQVAIGRWWDYAFGQGVRFYSGSATPYGFDYGFGFLPPTDPRDPEAFAEAVQDHMNPCERVEHNDRAFLPDPVYDSFWTERDYLRRIHKVKASVMIEGSWTDYNVHPVNSIEMWEALPASHPKRLIMGPWGHSDSQLPDAFNIRHAWFDHWLLGLDTGVMDLPMVDSLVGPNRTRFQDESWPPPGTDKISFLLRNRPGTRNFELQDRETAIWRDEQPMLSEGTVLNGQAGGAAIIFLGPTATKDTRLSGIPLLDARIVTDMESTFLTPVIFDVGSGDNTSSAQVITRGLLNSRNRNSLWTSIPLVPGEAWWARVLFQPIDWVLQKGHRLGLALMSMNSDEALYPDETRATNEVLLDGRSRLVLPLNPNTRVP